jgi:hypothetical protein
MKTKLNIPLLKRLRTRFLRMRHEEHFNMDVIAERTDCGSAMCIAGHALDLQGYKARFDQYGALMHFETPNGRQVKHALAAAAKEMGMPYGDWSDARPDAYDLFNDTEAIRTPKQAAARIQELIESAEANSV